MIARVFTALLLAAVALTVSYLIGLATGMALIAGGVAAVLGFLLGGLLPGGRGG